MAADPHSSSPDAREANKPASSAVSDPPRTQDKQDGKENGQKKPSIFRRHPLWTLFGLLALIAVCIAGYLIWLVYFHPYESTDDAFVEARSFAIATKAAGYVESIDVTDNQHVEAGARLMTIDPTDYRIALDQAKGQVESARAAIASAEAQIAAAGAAIDEARAQQTSAAAALQFAQEEANRQQDLAKSGAVTVQTAQQATSSLRQAQANAAQTQASVVSAMKNKAVAEAQRANAIASLHQAEAGAAAAEQKLKDTVIIAQQAGRIVQLSGAKGQFVTEGQSLAMFVPDAVWVIANFKETQLTDMRPGQAVALTIDAYPDHPLTGKVDSIQPGSGTAFSLLPAENATGNYVKVTQRVPVKITVDRWPQDVPVGPGMSVVPSVTVRPRS